LFHLFTFYLFTSKPEKKLRKLIIPKEKKEEKKMEEIKDEKIEYVEENSEFLEEIEKEEEFVEKKPWRKEVWQLSIWNYEEISMIFFCFFNPIHVLMIYIAKQNFLLILFSYSHSFLIYFLIHSFEQKEIDNNIKTMEVYNLQMNRRKPTLANLCYKKIEKEEIIQ